MKLLAVLPIAVGLLLTSHFTPPVVILAAHSAYEVLRPSAVAKNPADLKRTPASK